MDIVRLALMTLPAPMVVMSASPRMTTLKYSGSESDVANDASVGAKRTRMTTPTRPPKAELNTAICMASDIRPCWFIG